MCEVKKGIYLLSTLIIQDKLIGLSKHVIPELGLFFFFDPQQLECNIKVTWVIPFPLFCLTCIFVALFAIAVGNLSPLCLFPAIPIITC